MTETRKVVPVQAWPPHDREAWRAASDPGDIFADAPGYHRLNERSLQSIAGGYGRWIGYLHATEPAALLLDPADRVTELRARDYASHLAATLAPGGLWNYLKNLHAAVRLMAPARDWRWLRAMVAAVERDLRPRSKRHLLVEVSRLVDLGLDLMARASHGPDRLSLRRAITYRDGLLIAFLTYRPVRRRSLALMTIDRHLLKTSDGYLVAFEPGETKTGEPLEYCLPDLLVPSMDRYLAAVRPVFPNADSHQGLWASAKGRAMDGNALNLAVKRCTKAAFGHAIHLHLFRDCATTDIFVHAPAQVAMASDLLGHRDLRMTERFYNQACALEAGRQYHAVMADLRDRLIGNPGPGRSKKE